MNSRKILFSFIIIAFACFGLASHVGAAEGDLVRITDDTVVSTTESVGISYAKQSSVAYLENGNYVVVWDDWCDSGNNCPNDSGSGGLFFQLFTQDGEKIGGAVDTGLTSGYGKTTGVAEVDGGFVVSSQSEYRIFSLAGAPLTAVLDYAESLDNDWFPIRRDISGGFAVGLQKTILGSGYPYLEIYDTSGNQSGSVELGADPNVWGVPNFIALQDDSGYLAVLSTNDEIYGQFISASLELSGDLFRIDQSDSPMLGRNDSYELIQNSQGDILVSWYDARVQQHGSYPDKVYGRLMDSTGSFLTDEFVIASDLADPAFIGQQGSSIYTYIPPAMAVLGEKFVVAWMEKDGVDQSNMATHVKGIIVDGDGNLEGEVFKMETNEYTVNPTRRALLGVLASNGTDNLALTWFDGRNSYIDGENAQHPGTQIMANFWEIEGAPADDNPEDADVDSWKAYLVTDRTSCPVKLRLDIKGKHFDDDAEVRIGSKEASSVNVRSSKKIVAKFCFPKLLEKYAGIKRNISVTNPGADEEDADKKIDVALVTFPINAGNFDLNTAEGVKNIQRALVRLGYLDARYVTGFYGPITAGAVKKFQADNNLPPIGIFGPQTKAKLQQKVK